MDQTNFSTAIAEILKDRDVTQSELARMMGVTYQSVQATLSKENPKLETVVRYLSNLGYDVAFVRRGKRLPEGSYVIGSSKEHE